MSRIGRKPVKISQGVTVTVNGSDVVVTGPKGALKIFKRPEIEIKNENGELVFSVIKPGRESSAYMGLTRALLNNMVKGVSEGFEKKLELVGVGYRAKMNGTDTLTLTVGYSHPVDFKVPAGIHVEVTEQFVSIKGADRQQVGQIAADIRKIRKPEPYKGKGIKYTTEFVRRKQGKSGKV